MKRVLLASAGMLTLAALMGAAGAADLPRRYDPMVTKAPIYSPAYNWTGFYLGISGGYGWGQSEWDTTSEFDLSGGLVGGTAGYNWQSGMWVFGLEGDLSWSGIKGNTTTFFCPLGCETKNEWLGTVRGRLGYAFDRFLPYVTGGLAVGEIKAVAPPFTGASETNAGWTFGGGVEFAIVNNWTAKAEYLYVDLGEINCGLACSGFTPNNVTFTTNIFRGGVNYRF